MSKSARQQLADQVAEVKALPEWTRVPHETHRLVVVAPDFIAESAGLPAIEGAVNESEFAGAEPGELLLHGFDRDLACRTVTLAISYRPGLPFGHAPLPEGETGPCGPLPIAVSFDFLPPDPE